MADNSRTFHIVRCKSKHDDNVFADVVVLDAICLRRDNGDEDIYMVAAKDAKVCIVDPQADGDDDNSKGTPDGSSRVSAMERLKGDPDDTQILDFEVLRALTARSSNGGEETFLFSRPQAVVERVTDNTGLNLRRAPDDASRAAHIAKITETGGTGASGGSANTDYPREGTPGGSGDRYTAVKRIDGMSFNSSNGAEFAFLMPDPATGEDPLGGYIDTTIYNVDGTPPDNKDSNVYVAFPKASAGPWLGNTTVPSTLLWWIKALSAGGGGYLHITISGTNYANSTTPPAPMHADVKIVGASGGSGGSGASGGTQITYGATGGASGIGATGNPTYWVWAPAQGAGLVVGYDFGIFPNPGAGLVTTSGTFGITTGLQSLFDGTYQVVCGTILPDPVHGWNATYGGSFTEIQLVGTSSSDTGNNYGFNTIYPYTSAHTFGARSFTAHPGFTDAQALAAAQSTLAFLNSNPVSIWNPSDPQFGFFESFITWELDTQPAKIHPLSYTSYSLEVIVKIPGPGGGNGATGGVGDGLIEIDISGVFGGTVVDSDGSRSLPAGTCSCTIEVFSDAEMKAAAQANGDPTPPQKITKPSELEYSNLPGPYHYFSPESRLDATASSDPHLPNGTYKVAVETVTNPDFVPNANPQPDPKVPATIFKANAAPGAWTSSVIT